MKSMVVRIYMGATIEDTLTAINALEGNVVEHVKESGIQYRVDTIQQITPVYMGGDVVYFLVLAKMEQLGYVGTRK